MQSRSHRTGTKPMTSFIAFLRANPGQWCHYFSYPNAQSAYQRTMRTKREYADLGFEFVTRQDDDGFGVYGRFVGTNTLRLDDPV